jgi:hypothetical protein
MLVPALPCEVENLQVLTMFNVGEGQLQAADFVMTPAVQFATANTGGIGGSLSTHDVPWRPAASAP